MRHVLSLLDLSADEIREVLALAIELKSRLAERETTSRCSSARYGIAV